MQKEYEGGCHCKAVRYKVELDLDKMLITCNCSICQMTGMMLSFVPEAQFTLLSGEDKITDYQFNKKVIHHFFCKNCGVRSFGKGSDGEGNKMVAINVRCLDGVHAEELSPQPHDGRSV